MKVLTVNFRNGERYFDVYGEKTIEYESVPIDIDFADLGLESAILNPTNLSEALSVVQNNWSTDTVVLSNDHVITYGGLKAWRKIYPDKKLGMIVLDWHMDIYSYAFVKEKLSKATLFRNALDEKLVDFIVFVGTRNSEEAIYHPLETKLDDYPEFYTGTLRKLRVFAGLDEKISVIPLRKITGLSQVVADAIGILLNHGCEKFGLDIDLDVFDSNQITGVEYNRTFPKRLIEFLKHRMSEKEEPPTLAVITDYCDYLRFMNYQIEEGGLKLSDIDKQLENLQLDFQRKKIRFDYLGLTEFEPAFDDGKTTELVKKLLCCYKDINENHQ